MSAVVTKKLGGDYATQLTFPAVFAQQAKASNLASQFYPDAKGRPMELLTGSGLQQDYHEQKRLDANRRCLNGLKDNAASMARYLSSHANYIVPKPVLSQRIYANPSNGNQSDIYSSRPVWNQSMSGGVLRTAEGQKWAMDKLKERIPQLDAIKAAKDAFLLGMPSASVGAESVGVSDITTKVELFSLLNRVASELEQGVVSNKTVEKSLSMLKLLFSYVPSVDAREVEEVMVIVENIKESLAGILEEGEEGVAVDKEGAVVIKNADYLDNLYEKIFQYLTRMNGVYNRSRKEREKASTIFIKALGFSEMEKKLPYVSRKLQREVAAAQAANPNADPEGEKEAEDEVMGDDEKYDDGDDEDEDQPPPAPPRDLGRAGPYATSSSLSSFPVAGPPSPRRPPRGDKDEAEFDEDQRQVLGDNSGDFVDKAPRSNMASAQMSEEQQQQLAPAFEPAVAAAAAAAAESKPRPPIIPPPAEEAAAAAASSEPAKPKLVKPFHSGLTQEELERLRRFKEIVLQYPPWLTKDSLKPENQESVLRNMRAEKRYNPRASSSEKTITDGIKLRIGPQVAVLNTISYYERKMREARERQEAERAAQKKK